MSEDKASFRRLVRNMQIGDNGIERTAKQLQQQGIPEHTAYYAAVMAFMRKRK